MSTPKWKAKEVRKLAKYKGKNYYYSHFHYFETEDGRRFVYAKRDEWNKDTKFFMVKDIGEHKSIELRYWIYPIPFEQAIDKSYNIERIRWFGCVRSVVVEIKR